MIIVSVRAMGWRMLEERNSLAMDLKGGGVEKEGVLKEGAKKGKNPLH